MPEAVVARYPQGMRAPATLELSGEPPWVLELRNGTPEIVFQQFAVNWVDARGNILFHFNPRPAESRVVLNSWFIDRWDEPISIPGLPFALEREVPFRIRFQVEYRRFHVFVDDIPYCEFELQSPPAAISEVRATAFLWQLRDAWRRPIPGLGFHPYGRAQSAEIVPPSWLGWRHDWVTAEANPPRPDPLDSFRFFAVIGTWMEADVIEATVANCRKQGCERVYLVDNGSPDQTVDRAVAAGAHLAARYDAGRYDELERIRRMQQVVDEVSEAQDDQHIWWLWLDADEFPTGPGGVTIRDHLLTLDRKFRVVGARFLNHFPTRRRAYVEGRNPLDFQPVCYEQLDLFCDLGHRKHPLLRWDRAAPKITAGIGFHTARAPQKLVEPTDPIVTHHFPFRNKAATRSRLAALFSPADGASPRIADKDNVATSHMRLRLSSLDDVYKQHWGKVRFFPPCAAGYVPELRPWQEVLAAHENVRHG